jgi:shikimate kinase
MANYRHPISPEAKKITGSKLRAQEVDMEIHWDKRHELYRVAAEITIPTRDKTPEQIAEEIMRAA